MSNLGIGVYVLTVVWFLSLMFCWVSVRTGHSIGKFSVYLSFLVTLALVAVPKGEAFYTRGASIYDNLLLVRYGVLSLLIVSVFCGTVYCFVTHCLRPVETKRVGRVGTN